MKKLFFTAMLLSLTITACSEKKEPAAEVSAIETTATSGEQKPADSATIPTKTVATTPEEEGKSLVEGADCLSCHKVDSKLVGPSYQDVAAKYTDADIDHLATKIIDGGKGVWGEIPMTPHAGMSKENAKKMVKYILSLKK